MTKTQQHLSSSMNERPPIVTLTDRAAERVKHLIISRNKPCHGIRVGVKSGGCSGLAYTFEYADEQRHFDEKVHQKGVTIFIDPKAVLYLVGTTLDYMDEKVKSGFVFNNPNEQGSCGCGASFSV